MAAAVPPPLKAADVSRFAHRAGQLETQKPVVAYYCYYWIIEQILNKGLQKADNDCMSYTTNLMDKLEQVSHYKGNRMSWASVDEVKMKTDYSEIDAIRDDVAGHAYIELFGLETFRRADNTMRANKVTRQTADTFQASATFLDLLQIWGPLDAEIAAKIRFAKYHALRIAKALKAGEDPNLSNPVVEPDVVTPSEKPLDPNDPDVQAINAAANENSDGRQATVEDAPDSGEQTQPFSSHQFYGAPPSPLAPVDQHPPLSPLEPGENYYTNPNLQPDVSPLAPPSADRKSSLGGGYFPTVPTTTSPPVESAPDISPPDTLPPSLPPFFPQDSPKWNEAPTVSSRPPTHAVQPPANFAPNHSAPRATPSLPPIVPPASQPSRQVQSRPPPLNPPPSTTRYQTPTPAAPPPIPADLSTDEEAIMAAQKHARWAISALNFEDVKTAVAELRAALDSLGAS